MPILAVRPPGRIIRHLKYSRGIRTGDPEASHNWASGPTVAKSLRVGACLPFPEPRFPGRNELPLDLGELVLGRRIGRSILPARIWLARCMRIGRVVYTSSVPRTGATVPRS